MLLSIHGLYWLWPLLTLCVWYGMLLGLLLWWAVEDDHGDYGRYSRTVLFISYVGAEHQWLFIMGSAMTMVTYTLTLLTERWLRHKRRLPHVILNRERTYDIGAVVFGFLGCVSLILCACFNCNDYSHEHWAFAAIFVVFLAISAVLQTLQIRSLKGSHPGIKFLRRSAIVKYIIVVIAISGAIAFGATYGASHGCDIKERGDHCDVIKSTCAALEWFIAFMLGLYFLTLTIDIWPAHRTTKDQFSVLEKEAHLQGVAPLPNTSDEEITNPNSMLLR